MNRLYIQCACFSAIALIVSACQRKQDPVAELEKAASTLTQPGPASTPSDASAAPAAAAPPATLVQEAITDYKAGKMEDAVTRLQLLRSAPTLTAEQRMAVQDSVAAVMSEVYALAEKGDQRAIAAVAKYEKMQTTR